MVSGNNMITPPQNTSYPKKGKQGATPPKKSAPLGGKKAGKASGRKR